MVVVCAATNKAPDSVKDEFCQNLESAMLLTKTSDLVVYLGDFNAVSGTQRTSPGVVGPIGRTY